jgi:hypothetical protein
VSALGRALTVAKNRDPKHAIKQGDRFFSNTGVDVWQMAARWVPFGIGPRPEVVAALDWTDFDADDQATIALHLVTKHNRSRFGMGMSEARVSSSAVESGAAREAQ